MTAKSESIYELIDGYIFAMQAAGKQPRMAHVTQAQYTELEKAHKKDWPDRQFNPVYRGVKIVVVNPGD